RLIPAPGGAVGVPGPGFAGGGGPRALTRLDQARAGEAGAGARGGGDDRVDSRSSRRGLERTREVARSRRRFPVRPAGRRAVRTVRRLTQPAWSRDLALQPDDAQRVPQVPAPLLLQPSSGPRGGAAVGADGA